MVLDFGIVVGLFKNHGVSNSIDVLVLSKFDYLIRPRATFNLVGREV